ncbi:flap structure-specific endonuclease [Caldisphaera lagunensis DSM 15908]|uniref:Flap endonuclease 1 n=1 Tax=Caldisphaera lagunensis (strain DSM 15908 / JCM 11604 / ANMR 0165 / IC-154) TaxID=1056495 RepID=L0ACI1_CALLD|nr:flap structure-specific endonuclease [Caldisphaera lagunensis DSM 15908]
MKILGVNLKDLIPEKAKQEIDLKALKGYTVALDGYNMLYQFLAAIRQPDGTPLIDSKGNITSHISGLFYRTINLIEEGVKPIYVFDGKPPEMKKKEIEDRINRRQQYAEKYQKAKQEGKIEEAKKYAQASTSLSNKMVEDAKQLLTYMGIPWVQAPADGEAQAAYMAKKGDVYATGSQDYDSLLFGSPKLLRNLAITGKRKLPNKEEYIEIKPELINLNDMLKALEITREQLIVIGILLGTDFNPDGFKGYGPKTALKYVKEHRDPIKALSSLKVNDEDIDIMKIYEYFLNPPSNPNYKIEWRDPNEEKIIDMLVREHDFNDDRVKKALERLKKSFKESVKSKQARLDNWF